MAERGPPYTPTQHSNGGVLKSPVSPSVQPTKRVSFSDPNANSTVNNNNINNHNSSINNNNNNSMDKIIEDPNVSS